MRRDTIFLVLYLMIIGALLVTQTPRYENRSVAAKDTTPVASQNNEPVADKPDGAGPQTVGTVDKTAIAAECEKELRRTADLLRFFANRLQTGEDAQSIIADMRQQEKKISAVCE
jgi:hypothetical protein